MIFIIISFLFSFFEILYGGEPFRKDAGFQGSLHLKCNAINNAEKVENLEKNISLNKIAVFDIELGAHLQLGDSSHIVCVFRSEKSMDSIVLSYYPVTSVSLIYDEPSAFRLMLSMRNLKYPLLMKQKLLA